MRGREHGGGDGDQPDTKNGTDRREDGERRGALSVGGQTPSPLLTKLYFRIGEVASALRVEPHVLRYWESEFRSVRPQKSARGQRVYSRRDVETLQRIRELLYDRGFTIAGARKELRDRGLEPRAESDPAVVEATRMRATLQEVRDEIVALLAEFGE